MITHDPLALAGACLQTGDYQGAERVSRRVVEGNPWVADAWFILGVASQLLGKLADSVDHYRRALGLAPYNAEAWNNMGASLLSLRRPEEAEPCIRQALQLDPGYAEAHNNLGNALQATGNLDGAVECYRRAIRINPRYVGAYDHLGLVLQLQGRLDEAVESFGQAIALAPEFAMARLNRSLAWLQMGDFRRGWPEYEWRWRCPEHPVPDLPQPVWDGGPLRGRTILLRAEQGFGDVIQFIRFARVVADRGGRVVVSTPRTLLALAASCPGVAYVVPDDVPPPASVPFDCHAPLMSLPWILGTSLETIPADVPYFTAHRELVRQWAERLPSDGFKVGIAWQGNPAHKKDRHRSFRLAQFAALAHLPGVRLFSLQKNVGLDQLDEVRSHFSVTDLGPSLGDFMDTAAVVMNLDLVITPDTAVAHLAAALGCPAWIALPFAADWRWGLGREDSPWYPTLRLFRQPRWGDWDSVFQAMRGELTARVPASHRPQLKGA